MLYRLKVRLLKTIRGNYYWRYWRGWRGDDVGSYARLPDYVRRLAPGKTFADIGCMWGVNGEYTFVAEEAGATAATGVDVFGPTPEFEEKRQARNSSVRFVLGDISRAETVERVGSADVVLCAGVLYHHPSPFDLLVALRRICRETLILRTSTIPEIDGLPNAAVYYPMLSAEQRKLWNLSNLGLLHQAGITNEFDPRDGYGNWFWGMTPSCVTSLLATAGFRVDEHAPEAFSHTFVCTAVEVPFAHDLPTEADARVLGQSVSVAGIARPA
jgi:2-polyprenyl-3-methyl-5-hydroxy-6-metoxy-1,4-benzoquinol methylase